MVAELRPLKSTKDFFKKIIIAKTAMKPWTDEDGILHLGLYGFLLDENSLEKWSLSFSKRIYTVRWWNSIFTYAQFTKLDSFLTMITRLYKYSYQTVYGNSRSPDATDCAEYGV